MGKSQVKANRPQRHDPLHVQLADLPEQAFTKKAPRQKFIDRNNRSEEADQVKKKKRGQESPLKKRRALTRCLRPIWTPSYPKKF